MICNYICRSNIKIKKTLPSFPSTLMQVAAGINILHQIKIISQHAYPALQMIS